MLSWLMPVAAFVVQPAGDLFGRPAVPQAVEHEAAQFAVALQPGSGPWRPFREEPTEEITPKPRNSPTGDRATCFSP